MPTKTDTNGQQKTQTLHIAVPLDFLRRVRSLALLDKRSLSAQAFWLMEQGLAATTKKGH